MHIACVGNAILDILFQFPSTDVASYVSNHTLQFPLGAKILIDSYELQLGGNASNVSVGLSRLGYQTSLFAEMGDDLFSEYIGESLKKDQVDITHLVKTGKTSLGISLNAVEDRVILVDHQKRNNDFTLPYESLDGVYLTSLGDNWERVYKTVLTTCSEKNIPVFCNPGSIQLKERNSFVPFLSQINVLFINVEEAGILVDYKVPLKKHKSTKENTKIIHELMEGLFAKGATTVVITDGVEGSYASSKTDSIIYHTPISTLPIVEKTGAGDAFASGFLGSFLETADLKQSLPAGTLNAGSVVSQIGAQPGLQTKEQLTQLLHTLPLAVTQVTG